MASDTFDVDVAWQAIKDAHYDNDLPIFSMAVEAVQEVERLQADNAALREIAQAVAAMRVEDGIFDQPLFALMSGEHEHDGAWHEHLVTQARALLADTLAKGDGDHE